MCTICRACRDATDQRNRDSYRDKAREVAYWCYKVSPDEQKERQRRYQKANPDKMREKEQRRNAQKRALPATLTDQEWINALEYFQHHCAYCERGVSLFDRDWILHQDHVIPLVKRGPYTKFNIVPACPSCNLSKHDHDLDQWLILRWGKRKATKILKRIQDYFATLSPD